MSVIRAGVGGAARRPTLPAGAARRRVFAAPGTHHYGCSATLACCQVRPAPAPFSRQSLSRPAPVAASSPAHDRKQIPHIAIIRLPHGEGYIKARVAADPRQAPSLWKSVAGSSGAVFAVSHRQHLTTSTKFPRHASLTPHAQRKPLSEYSTQSLHMPFSRISHLFDTTGGLPGTAAAGAAGF